MLNQIMVFTGGRDSLELEEIWIKNNNIVKEEESYSRIEEMITVQDIPHHISRSQIFFVIKHIE